MVKVKAFLLGADFVVLSISGYSFIDIISIFFSGNLAMSSIDNFIKLLFSMGGLIYLCVRIYNNITMGRLDRKYKEQEIIAKQQENHKNNTYKQFIESIKKNEKK